MQHPRQAPAAARVHTAQRVCVARSLPAARAVLWRPFLNLLILGGVQQDVVLGCLGVILRVPSAPVIADSVCIDSTWSVSLCFRRERIFIPRNTTSRSSYRLHVSNQQ